MESDLATFLAGYFSEAEELANWPGFNIRLRIAGYLSEELPPDPYLTSIRALVFHGDDILVVRDPTGFHIIPGGRREKGETIGQTLSREVMEETGWTLGRTSILGFMHCHHLTPKPPDYRFPYPDFIQLVCMADATTFVAQAKVIDEYVLESNFCPVAEVQQLRLASYEHLFLREALRRRAAFEE